MGLFLICEDIPLKDRMILALGLGFMAVGVFTENKPLLACGLGVLMGWALSA